MKTAYALLQTTTEVCFGEMIVEILREESSKHQVALELTTTAMFD